MNRKSSLLKLNGMSVKDIISCDCSDKGSKISIAFIEGGNITCHTFGKNGVVVLSNLSLNKKISMTVIGAKILTGKNPF